MKSPKIIKLTVFSLFLFPSFYSVANTEGTPTPISICLAKHKKAIEETITIDSETYTIPPSWQGLKIGARPLSKPPLVQVPPEFVKNGGTIYLLPEACKAFTTMAEAAKQNGIHLIIDSGYRSEWYQTKIFKRLMDKGKSFEEVARYVAPPGYSEHMLGLAVDFSPSDWRFVKSPVYPWLKEHGVQFGFAETYPEKAHNKRPWEPSHWRHHADAVQPQENI